jgi:hypothetical protein
MKIRVQIDRLVLDGLPVTTAQAERVRRAVEVEMGALLSGVRTRRFAPGAVPVVSAAPLHLTGHETPDALGARIARSLHDVLLPDRGTRR